MHSTNSLGHTALSTRMLTGANSNCSCLCYFYGVLECKMRSPIINITNCIRNEDHLCLKLKKFIKLLSFKPNFSKKKKWSNCSSIYMIYCLFDLGCWMNHQHHELHPKQRSSLLWLKSKFGQIVEFKATFLLFTIVVC